ncbi:hypothetical protein RFI_21358 [Reticulomyxa filosa]|uniref:DNA/RNA-binding protein Alba-like domain-containing protein n=1 Tax=Reticulomyxa filosa TaxID=46433 RepID=X6MRD9_RETFI|nr:hypothetical protein RFI_21358 [Reticulomyxa filosa]|eukprot:ETO16002.1 hypothetical protein RFI_21358 [Reticulomyxa filosa]
MLFEKAYLNTFNFLLYVGCFVCCKKLFKNSSFPLIDPMAQAEIVINGTTKSKYQRKKNPSNQPSIEENEVRVTTLVQSKRNICCLMHGLVKRYVDYAVRLLNGPQAKDQENDVKIEDENGNANKGPSKQYDTIVLKATGRAVYSAVTTAEVVKRKIANLHQLTTLDTLEVTDIWEPLEEGLKEVTTTRRVASISIILSRNSSELESTAIAMTDPEIQFQDDVLIKIASLDRGKTKSNLASIVSKHAIKGKETGDSLPSEQKKSFFDYFKSSSLCFWVILPLNFERFSYSFHPESCLQCFEKESQRIVGHKLLFNFFFTITGNQCLNCLAFDADKYLPQLRDYTVPVDYHTLSSQSPCYVYTFSSRLFSFFLFHVPLLTKLHRSFYEDPYYFCIQISCGKKLIKRLYRNIFLMLKSQLFNYFFILKIFYAVQMKYAISIASKFYCVYIVKKIRLAHLIVILKKLFF